MMIHRGRLHWTVAIETLSVTHTLTQSHRYNIFCLLYAITSFSEHALHSLKLQYRIVYLMMVARACLLSIYCAKLPIVCVLSADSSAANHRTHLQSYIIIITRININTSLTIHVWWKWLLQYGRREVASPFKQQTACPGAKCAVYCNSCCSFIWWKRWPYNVHGQVTENNIWVDHIECLRWM